MAFYRCPYILRTGEVCNRGCYHPDGCYVHRDSPIRIPCKEYGCSELNRSKYGYCDLHARKHRKKKQYHQKKLEKIAQNGESEIRCSASSEVKDSL
jgi:hypothetical protein